MAAFATVGMATEPLQLSKVALLPDATDSESERARSTNLPTTASPASAAVPDSTRPLELANSHELPSASDSAIVPLAPLTESALPEVAVMESYSKAASAKLARASAPPSLTLPDR